MTFDEWKAIWVGSGHWHERGRRLGQYCMARYGDKGPYAVGNVRIVKAEENHAERKRPHAVLTEDEVRQIRRKYASGKFMMITLAEQYAVSDATVSHIISGRRWNKLV